jgi:hypothetical protein
MTTITQAIEATAALYTEAGKGELTESQVRNALASITVGRPKAEVVEIAVAVLGSTPARTRIGAFDAMVDRIARRAAMVRRCAVIDTI